MLEVAQSIDKYVMQERLGQSSTSEVWRAFDQTLQRPVVIKFLRISQQKHAHSIQRLQQNFSVLVSLRHPNIIQIYDISSRTHISGQFEGSSAYVVMPDIAGTTLANYNRQAIKQGKKPSSLEIAQLFVPVGSALDYAHQRGVIHCSLKPANILLDQQNTTFLIGEPVITDFGLMSLENSTHAKAQSSLYTAPEQALGGVVTEQYDIYALGIILYELSTGKHPFEDLGQGSDQHLIQAVFDPIPPSRVNQAISPALEAVILQSIAREPEERFADVRTMVLALLQALNIPLAPSLCMEYHVSFLEVLQNLAEEAKDNIIVSEMIDVQKLFADGNDTVGRASPCGGLVPPTNHSHNPTTVDENAYNPTTVDENAASPTNLIGNTHTPSIIGETGPPQGEARPTFRSLYAYRFIPFSIIPLLLIVSMLLGSLGVWQATPAVGGTPPGQILGGGPSGTVYFLSSSQGINDEVNVDLTHMSPPMPQKSYYVWLQADESISDSSFLPLGQLNVSQGSAHFRYEDPQHMNLLATWSRFLITEEDAIVPPSAPSLDLTTWLAVGEISQQRAPNDQKHYSLLDHIRHLLASDPDLNSLDLPGGLSVWLTRSMRHMQDYAKNSQDSFSTNNGIGLRNQLVLLLSDIDGTKEMAHDIPPHVPLLNDGASAQVGLLQIHSYQQPPSYLYHIASHVLGLISAPGATPAQQKIADTVGPVINIINNLLEQIRNAVIPLIALSPQQLLQPRVEQQLATITHMATTAYQGQGTIKGVTWMSAQLASLAIIPVHAPAS